MDSRSSIRSLVEGAFSAALATLLALMGIYLPIISGLFDLVWTVPLTVLVIRQDIRLGVLALLVSGLLILMLSDPLRAVFLLIQFGAVGLFYGIAFKRRMAPGISLLIGMVTAGACMVAVAFIGFWLTGINWAEIQRQLYANIDPMMDLYRQLGLLQSYAQKGITEEVFRQEITRWVGVMLRLLPGILISGAALGAVANYYAAYAVLKRLRIPVVKVAPFREWQLPWYLTWGVILGFAAWLGGDYLQIAWLATIGQNILMVYAPFLMIFGLSVGCFYYTTSRLPKWLKVVLVVLAVFYMHVSLLMLIMLGLFDPLFDYRKLRRPS